MSSILMYTYHKRDEIIKESFHLIRYVLFLFFDATGRECIVESVFAQSQGVDLDRRDVIVVPVALKYEAFNLLA